jgi:hypothetical protein
MFRLQKQKGRHLVEVTALLKTLGYEKATSPARVGQTDDIHRRPRTGLVVGDEHDGIRKARHEGPCQSRE